MTLWYIINIFQEQYRFLHEALIQIFATQAPEKRLHSNDDDSVVDDDDNDDDSDDGDIIDEGSDI